jgi:hypothetical protein
MGTLRSPRTAANGIELDGDEACPRLLFFQSKSWAGRTVSNTKPDFSQNNFAAPIIQALARPGD